MITLEEAKVKATSFINENLMQPGRQVTVKEAMEENGLYKIVVTMPGAQGGQSQT